MTVKTKAAAAVLALGTIFSVAAAAQPAVLTACTKDGKTATLKADIDGTLFTPMRDKGIEGQSISAQDAAQAAFTLTAQDLTAAQLIGPKGKSEFNDILSGIEGFMQRSEDYKLEISGPPTVGAPACAAS